MKEKRYVLNIEEIKKQLMKSETINDGGQLIKSLPLINIADCPSGIPFPVECKETLEYWKGGPYKMCPRCKGETEIRNKYYKKKTVDRITRIIEKLRVYDGEHNTTDHTRNKLGKLLDQYWFYMKTIECPDCQGTGSIVLNKDIKYFTQILNELSNAGLYYRIVDEYMCIIMEVNE